MGMYMEKWRDWWLKLPLQGKVRFATFPAAAALLITVAVTVMAVHFGVGGFGRIMAMQTRELEFSTALDAEINAFDRFAQSGDPEDGTRYEETKLAAETALKRLPLDYGEMGAERYQRTWSIKNTYETYAKRRDRLLNLDRRAPEYIEELYGVYTIQNYLMEYAGRLQQLSARAGSSEYKSLIPVLAVWMSLSVAMAAVSGAILAALNANMNRYLIRPVRQLADEAARIGAGDFTERDIPVSGDDEMARLVRAFMEMKRSTKGYIVTMRENHAMEQQMEAIRLQMLKNQINPHFLFNTLNMIEGMAQIEDAEVTERMIEALSRLFRYNLKTTASMMPLDREITVVKDYVYLQKMRFGDRIRCSFDCRQDTLHHLVPSFALQPLIENAIIHGLTPRPEGGAIYVRTWMEGERVFLSVADTGVGIAADRLLEIRDALKQGAEDKTGVGIGNIYRRIHTMCRDGSFFIDSVKGHGTVIQISFCDGEAQGE